MLSATRKSKFYTVLDYLSSKTASLGLDEEEYSDQASNSSRSNASIDPYDDDQDLPNPEEMLQSN